MSAGVAPEVAAEARRLLEQLLTDLGPERTELEGELRRRARLELERRLTNAEGSPLATWEAQVADQVPEVADPWCADG